MSIVERYMTAIHGIFAGADAMDYCLIAGLFDKMQEVYP